MRNSRSILRTLVAGLALVFTLTLISAGMTQSGRRVKKTPAPAPSAETTPTAAKPAEKTPPAVTFVVGMDHYSGLGGTRGTYSSDVLLSLADRLDDNPSVEVSQVRSSMSRGDAVNRARSEKEAYVVWMELRNDSRTVSTTNDGQFYIQYWVFYPTTAKLKTSGQTYPGAYRNRGVVVNPRTTNIYGDYQLQQAARQAAEKILDAFKLQVPDRPILMP